MTNRVSHFDRLVDAAKDATDRTSAVTSTFVLAGRRLRLVGAGGELVDRIAPSFAHLPRGTDDVDADLTVMLWDTASTGVALPDLGDFAPERGQPITPILHGAGRSFVFHAYENAISYLDHERGIGVYAVEDARLLPPWERACPLRALLTWWLSPLGLLLAHGAGVGSELGAVLLAGPGGSGKSTTAMACLAAGMGYLGDDYVLLDPSTRTLYCTYGSSKLAPDHLRRFPNLMDAEPRYASDPEDAKRIGWPGRTRPGSIVLSAPIRAILIPVVTHGRECTLTPVPSSRALLAIAPLTMFQTPGDQRAAFDLSSRIVKGIPAYRLELGDGMDAVPEMIQRVIDDGTGPP